MDLKKTRAVKLWKLTLRYLLIDAGMPVHSFNVEGFNRSWSISLFFPQFVYCGDVARNLRTISASNPKLARFAGLDFPAHGVE